MRRIADAMKDLKLASLGDPASTLPGGQPETSPLLDLTLDLTAVTPVLGGGVQPFVPGDPDLDDDPDPVRVPAIRGQLRQWARWTRTAKPYAEEAELWGGVEAEGEKAVHPSRVRLSVEIRNPGSVRAAGVHPAGNNGAPGNKVEWGPAANGLDYALFPLQVPEAEKKGLRGPAPTRQFRIGTALRLHVSLTPPPARPNTPKPSPERTASQVNEVLAALWAWLHLGGIGARTRRGFGAMRASRVTSSTGLADLGWTERMFMPETLADWEAGWDMAVSNGSRLGHARLLAKRDSPEPVETAHKQLVGHLFAFRQGPGQGRQGVSLWPEANLLRLRRGGGVPQPDQPFVDAADAGHVGTPRAAFGMPLQIKFKDKVDEPANATLTPAGHNRMASPVLLRPLVLKQVAHAMVIMLRPEADLRAINADFDKEKQIASISSFQTSAILPDGAKEPVSNRLRDSGGDALLAYERRLRSVGFKLLRGAP